MQNRFVGFHIFGSAEDAQLKRLVSDAAVIVRRADHVSVYDAALPLNVLEQKACTLSMHTSAPVIFAAAGEDTFLLGRCMMGFTVLRHCIGNCAAAGLRETHAQSRDLAEQLHIEGSTDAVRKLVRERDVDAVINQLQAMTGISFIA